MKTRFVLFLAAAMLPFTKIAAQEQPIVQEAALSPSGERLAFILNDGERSEVLLYDFGSDSIQRLTDSGETAASLSSKSSLNWIDESRILFLSKHTGLFQQYVIDTRDMTMTPNGTSGVSEYDLVYYDGRSYYIQFSPPAGNRIFYREAGGAAHMLTTRQQTYSMLRLSPDGRYATVQESPDMGTVIIDIATGKAVRSKLPAANTILLAWAPGGDRFLYTEAKFDIYTGGATEYLAIYNIDSQKSTQLGSDSNNFVVGAIWAPYADKFLYVKGTSCRICDAQGNELKSITVEGRPLCWMPDMRRAVFTNGPEIFMLDTENSALRSLY